MFLKFLSARGLDQVAEKVLSYLDAAFLKNAELVCKEWYRVISEGMLWKKLIQKKVRSDPLWQGLSERRGWYVFYRTGLIVTVCVVALLLNEPKGFFHSCKKLQ